MRQIAKWTFLCIICTVCGFGATYLVANSDRVIQTFVAMLPTASQPTVDELAVSEADTAANEMDMTSMAAMGMPALAPLSSESTVGTLAAGPTQIEAKVAQAPPTTATNGFPASPSNGPLNAVGVIAVVRDRQVVLGASGTVNEIAVEVGDSVSQGDLLVSLDTTQLDWAVEQAELNFESARIDFEEAGEEFDEADIAVAEANLLLAQENLAEVEAGPSAEELAAAESSAAAAWAALEELQAGPTQAEITIAQAELRRAEIALQAAQREYDRIAWLPEAAATTAADELQSATITYEAAKAAYELANRPPTQADIQAATATAQSAQASLNELRRQPTQAAVAAARAQVAEAEAALADVMEGPQQGAVRQAELGVREAMIALENARLARENANVVAPIDGTVLAVNVDLGQQASEGEVVAVLADTANVNLTVNVEQRDIARVIIGQEVDIAIYALPSDTFRGVVEQIAPIADAETGFVTFPVIIRFTDGPMEKVLPGMTASATFIPLDGAEPSATDEAPADEATAEPTATPTEESEATEEATPEATTETPDPTATATADESTEETDDSAEDIPEATSEPTEEPDTQATATPSN